MKMVIVPESLRLIIEAKLDAQIALCPGAAVDRAELYSKLLAFYDENGYVPNFSLQKSETDDLTDEKMRVAEEFIKEMAE